MVDNLKHMEEANLILDNITILEWYDGVVRAIGNIKDERFLIILVAWDMVTSQKLYILVKLNPELADEFVNELADDESKEERWEKFNFEFNDYMKKYNDIVYIVFGEPKETYSFIGKKIVSTYVKSLVNYEFENTLSDQAKDFWFNIVKKE